jgi:hypothetical protein
VTIVPRPRSAVPVPAPLPVAAGATLDAATGDLVRRAARLADGLAFLERGHLECVAILLGVIPQAVERARQVLADPLARAAAEEAHRSARARPEAPAAHPAPPAAPRTAEALVREAERRDGGVALLATSAAECAAVVFGVTPALVAEARALLARRGLAPGPSTAE